MGGGDVECVAPKMVINDPDLSGSDKALWDICQTLNNLFFSAVGTRHSEIHTCSNPWTCIYLTSEKLSLRRAENL